MNEPTSYEEILAWELSDNPKENGERAFLGMKFLAQEAFRARRTDAVSAQRLESNWDPRGERSQRGER